MALRTVAKEHTISTEHVSIGHDILSLISSAMYVQPLTIYRELIQNCADSIDNAIATNQLKPGKGQIQLVIDPLHRQITVRDNGHGIPNAEFVDTMCSIGASKKRGTGSRGFRGIGRLVGLGYAQELVFRSRSLVNDRVMEATWDARLLKELLASRHRAPLDEIVAEVVKITERPAGPDEPEHFFETELRKVVRLADDALLNSHAVERYLSQVAPVPFHSSFSLAPALVAALSSYGPYPAVNLRINGGEPVTRPYRDDVPISASKTAHLFQFDIIQIPSYDGDQIAAVAWIARHEYFGAVPRRLGIRGLRARIGNLQIGDERVFAAAFPEERFVDWTIGEVHFYDSRITPNGRRDDFEPSLHFSNVLAHLDTAGRDAARAARSSSAERRIEKGLSAVQNALKEYTRLLKSSPEAYVLREELLADVRDELDRAQRRLSSGGRGSWVSRFADIARQIDKTESLRIKGRSRTNQRSMGRVDVLRALRSEIPGGLEIATTLLRILAKAR